MPPTGVNLLAARPPVATTYHNREELRGLNANRNPGVPWKWGLWKGDGLPESPSLVSSGPLDSKLQGTSELQSK